MTSPRIDPLFVRYWDDALSDAEAEELAGLLRQSPTAQRQFQLLSFQAVAATESAAVSSPTPARKPLTPSRRQLLVLGGVGGGFAVAFGIGLGRPIAARRPVGAVLIRTVGRVLIRSEVASLGAVVGPGDTLAVEGVGSSAVLESHCGSEVILTGDTVATLDAGSGPRLIVHRGGVAADLAAGGPDALTLATNETTAAAGGERSRFTLGRFGRQTEVGVLEGLVRLARPGGRVLLEMASGEVGTVTPTAARKEARPLLPTDYAWDFTRPLPAGWQAGRIVPSDIGPVAAATYWTGKEAAPAYQVRSVNGWMNGLIALEPESVLSIKYRVKQPAEVQAFLVVRPEQVTGPTAFVFDTIRPPQEQRPGVWQTISVKVGAMKVTTCNGDSAFGPPWVGFIVGMNTFDRDVGLQVAECRITRAGLP